MSVRIMLMGQSEIEYIINKTSFFNQFPKPTVSKANAVIVTQTGSLAAPVKTTVSQAAVDAGDVSYSMAALSEILRRDTAPCRVLV